MGLQHIPSTASALPRREEWLLPHLVSVGSSRSLGLNPCGSRGQTSLAVPSSATASSPPLLFRYSVSSGCVLNVLQWRVTLTSLGKAWADTREREKHYSCIILSPFFLLAAAWLSGKYTPSSMLVPHTYHSTEEAPALSCFYWCVQ